MLWLLALKRFAQFSGRSGRAEFWQFVIAYAAVVSLVAAYEVNTYAYQLSGDAPLALLVLMMGMLPFYAVTFRRLHDRGRSGWLIGAIWLLNAIWFGLYDSRELTRDWAIDPALTIVAGIEAWATLALIGFLVLQVSLPGHGSANRFGLPDDGSTLNVPRYATGAVAQAPSSMPPRGDPLDMLERLAGLRDQGALSDAEFDAQKVAILSRLGARL
ncbi:MAG: DUF805 domain-containing protein [Alphaproteobacteria bacterium]|nr:MAG: DUF805 domain-containing protein [Alphaproteobacteria bacterium]